MEESSAQVLATAFPRVHIVGENVHCRWTTNVSSLKPGQSPEKGRKERHDLRRKPLSHEALFLQCFSSLCLSTEPWRCLVLLPPVLHCLLNSHPSIRACLSSESTRATVCCDALAHLGVVLAFTACTTQPLHYTRNSSDKLSKPEGTYQINS